MPPNTAGVSIEGTDANSKGLIILQAAYFIYRSLLMLHMDFDANTPLSFFFSPSLPHSPQRNTPTSSRSRYPSFLLSFFLSNHSAMMQIFVKTLNGRTIALDVEENSTLMEVKKKIFVKEAFPVEEQR